MEQEDRAMNQTTREAIAEHFAEIKHGKRSINSKFRSVCSHCHYLFIGEPGAPCPRGWTRAKCTGTLQPNAEFKA